jgi:hypothetical protein
MSGPGEIPLKKEFSPGGRITPGLPAVGYFHWGLKKRDPSLRGALRTISAVAGTEARPTGLFMLYGWAKGPGETVQNDRDIHGFLTATLCYTE